MSYAALLAKEYGWTHGYIMGLPFGLVLAYAHAAQVLEGAAMRWVAADEVSARADFNRLKEFLNDESEGLQD